MNTKNKIGTRPGPCLTCRHMQMESDGGEPEYAIEWPTCRRFPQSTNLRTFPFKAATCHELEFWHSPFAAKINGSTIEEVDTQTEKAMAKYRSWLEKTYNTKEPAVER